MTAASFADMLNARRCGPGKWQARCPAHEDRSPSLSIAEGRDGRVLVRCWAGCTTENICASLGITLRDLFAGEPATPHQMAALAAQRKYRDERERWEQVCERAKRKRVWELEQLINAIGANLARSPDDRKLGRLFHEACEKWHAAETALYPRPPELGGLRMEAPVAIQSDMTAALAEIGQSFEQGKGPLDAGLERIA